MFSRLVRAHVPLRRGRLPESAAFAALIMGGDAPSVMPLVVCPMSSFTWTRADWLTRKTRPDCLPGRWRRMALSVRSTEPSFTSMRIYVKGLRGLEKRIAFRSRVSRRARARKLSGRCGGAAQSHIDWCDPEAALEFTLRSRTHRDCGHSPAVRRPATPLASAHRPNAAAPRSAALRSRVGYRVAPAAGRPQPSRGRRRPAELCRDRTRYWAASGCCGSAR